jgi:large-conductance mechanosensitive channel
MNENLIEGLCEWLKTTKGITKIHIEELTAFGGVKYGMFLSSVINFVIVSFVLFLIINCQH